jgi:phosphohistidine phosphatase SixA
MPLDAAQTQNSIIFNGDVMKRRIMWGMLLFFCTAFATITFAQTLSGPSIVAALRQGGYVIVMRHTSSPRETPSKQTANADNLNLERQLDETGRTGATAMGKAVRDLRIPIGEVLSSPTYRAMETVKFAQLNNPQTHPELGDRGQSMQGVSDADGAWLRQRVGQAPKSGNTIIITHMPNISRAFPQISGVADGESLIFRPDSKGGAILIGRIKIEEWPTLKP